jgi:PAS domain S-box-containing protein
MSSQADVDAAIVADGAPALLGVIDRAARLGWCNRTWSEFAGRDGAQLLGDQWLADLHADDVELVRLVVGHTEPFDIDVRMRRHDGRERWMAMRGSAHDDHVTIISAVDVSESRKAQHALQLLTAVGDELNASLATDEILDGVARLLVSDLADLCTIAVRDDQGRLTRLAIVDTDKRIEAELRARNHDVIDTDGPSAIAQVVRTGALLYRPLVDAPGPDEPSPPLPEALAPAATRSLICAPLRTRDEVIGALALVSWSRRYTPDDVELAHGIAQRCASAVENASLYRRSEDARARLSLVATIGERLATTFDMDAMADMLVRRIVPVFADVASVALYDDDGVTLRRRAFCHVDPGAEAEFRAGPYDTPIAVNGADPPARAARTGRPVLIEEHSSRGHPRGRRAADPGEAMRMLAPNSVLAMPLMSRGRTLGVLTVGFVSSGRRYSVADLPLANDLARRVAIAIERATAFTEERRIAEALQHSMLPDAMPDIPGVNLCVRYLPGGKVDVGGDWYDVVPLPGGRYGIVIGDVAGHGVRAATVMGQLRHALRAFAADGVEPAGVVARLNRFVFEQGPLDMATLCYGVLDPTRGRIDFSTAAHVPPLLIRPDHSAVLIELPPAPPIGADPLSRYTTTSVQLEPGAVLLLYTDGLVERRGEPLDVGLTRIVEAASSSPTPLDETCAHFVDVLLGDARPADDVAVLALRFAGLSRGHLRVRRPARAAELSPVRRIMGAWLESAGFGAEEIGSIAVAVTEAATNAVEHAYGPAEGWFEVEGEIHEDGSVGLTVRDGGRWRPKARGGGGRGLALIARLMDEFEVRRRQMGTEIWMRRAPRGERTPHDVEVSG